jgi:hypothetical protein
MTSAALRRSMSQVMRAADALVLERSSGGELLLPLPLLLLLPLILPLLLLLPLILPLLLPLLLPLILPL